MQKLETQFKDLQDSNLHMFLYISEILGRLIVDAEGQAIGKLVDLKVRLGELFPKVVTLVVKKRKTQRMFELDWQEVQSLNTAEIRLRPGAAEKFRPMEVNPQEILLREELFDKQVVDTLGAKIERVNDIHLLLVNQDLRIVHVDYGIRGILRRLGWLKNIDFLTHWLFAYQFEEKMISWKYIQPLSSDPIKQNLKLNVTSRKMQEIHPSDLADIIEDLDRISRTSVFRALDLQTAAQTLEEVDPRLQGKLLESSSIERVSDILEQMAPDEATDLLADLPEEKKQSLIRTMEKPSREAVQELLQFKEGTAGSIMTNDFLSINKDRTIGDAIVEFRKVVYPLDSISYIYVTDADNHLVGVSTLRHLITCEKEARLGTLMNTHLVKVEPEDDVDAVAELFKKYKFMCIPVVDSDNILKGVITLNDIMQSHFEEYH